MPIVGSTTSANTTILGETTFVETQTASAEPETTEVANSPPPLPPSSDSPPSSLFSPISSQGEPQSTAIVSSKPPAAATVSQTVVTRKLNVLLSHNVSDYSHSTVFTMFHYEPLSELTIELENKPPLTTAWTSKESCKGRWILHATSEAVITTATSPRSDIGINTAQETSTRNEQREILTLVFSTLPGKSDAEFDPLYTSCQPYGIAPTYSPAVCPEGQTLAEITEHHLSESGTTTHFWQGSCCQSGMTFGTEWPSACISRISTGLPAFAPVTIDSTAPPVYELTTQFTTGGVASTTTISSIKTVATGIAIADPVIVAWEEHDMSVFPPDYVSSLAKRIGVTPTSMVHSNNGHLSTGTKAGIGVGVILGALLISLGVVLWYIRRRRRSNTAAPSSAGGAAEMEADNQRHGMRTWFLNGRWRSEADSAPNAGEIDSKAVHVVPGPPAELDGRERELEMGQQQREGPYGQNFR